MLNASTGILVEPSRYSLRCLTCELQMSRPTLKLMKNFKALHGRSLWIGKRLPIQTDYAIVVHNKYSAPFSDLLMGLRLTNCMFDLLVHSPYFYVSELLLLSRTVPQVALPMLVRKSI